VLVGKHEPPMLEAISRYMRCPDGTLAEICLARFWLG